jgi:hypothetical protein
MKRILISAAMVLTLGTMAIPAFWPFDGLPVVLEETHTGLLAER